MWWLDGLIPMTDSFASQFNPEHTNLPPIKKSVGGIHSLIRLSSFLILVFNNSYQMLTKKNTDGIKIRDH